MAQDRPEQPPTPDEAVRLLLADDRATASDQGDAAALAKALALFRPALVLAAAFMQRLHVPPLGYRAELQKRMTASPIAADATAHAGPMAAAWRIAVDAATEENAAARSLLDLLSFMAPAPLPRSVLTADPSMPGDDPAGVAAVEALAGFGLIDATPEAISMPRAVRELAIADLGATGESRLSAFMRLMARAMPPQPADEADVAPTIALLPHAVAAARIGEAAAVDLPTAARLFRDLALFYRSVGHSADAEYFLVRAVGIGRTAIGRDHPEIAEWLGILGEMHVAKRRFGQAVPALETALSIMKQNGRRKEPRLALWLQNLADAYRGSQRLDDAEKAYAYLMTSASINDRIDRHMVDHCREGLAEIHMARGDFDKAEDILVELLTEAEASRNRDELLPFARSYKLADLYKKSGQHEKAEPLLARLQQQNAGFTPTPEHALKLLKAFGNDAMVDELTRRDGLSRSGRRIPTNMSLAACLATLRPPP